MKNTPHSYYSYRIATLILAALSLSTMPAGFALDVSASPFSGTTWTRNGKNGLVSTLVFKANGEWAEIQEVHPLKGTWRTTKDDNIVEVAIDEGKVGKKKTIHFLMSPDGMKCTRVEDSLNWEKSLAQTPATGDTLGTHPAAVFPGLPAPAPASRAPILAQSKDAAENQLVLAPWKLTSRWWFKVCTFARDGTFTIQGMDDQSGTWEIANNMVALNYKDGHKESLNLPVDPGGTTGNDKEGNLINAVMENPTAPAPKAVDMQTTTAQLVSGPWRVKGGWWTAVRVFAKDGTFTTVGNGGDSGTWKIANNTVILTFPDGHNDTFLLPLDPKGTDGADRDGRPTCETLQDPAAEKMEDKLNKAARAAWTARNTDGTAPPAQTSQPVPPSQASPPPGSVFGNTHP